MKIVIEQDMEGCAGILAWRWDLVAAGKHDWAMRVMTDEVNAAIEGALAAGAREIFAMEAHPFDMDRLHPAAQIIQCPCFDAPRDFDLLFFVGRHAMSGTADGILSHTGSSRSIRQVRVNGRPFGGFGLTAAWFGNLGTPGALVAGDEAACREARDFLGANVETAAVKRGVSAHAGVSLHPQEACRRIRQAAENAVRRARDFRPFTVPGPVVFEVEYTRPEVADWVCRLPWLERTTPLTTRVTADTYEAALRMYYAQGAMLWRYDA